MRHFILLGKEVNWVQCESECFKWFHLVCVGLKKSEVKKLESYQCKQCTEKKQENETEIKVETEDVSMATADS